MIKSQRLHWLWIIGLGFIALIIFQLYSLADQFNPQQIKKILASPTKNASVNFEIPMDVTILDVTDDLNWYKVKIGFDFLGHHEYQGWSYIPIGNYIRENEKKPNDALAPKPLPTTKISAPASEETIAVSGEVK